MDLPCCNHGALDGCAEGARDVNLKQSHVAGSNKTSSILGPLYNLTSHYRTQETATILHQDGNKVYITIGIFPDTRVYDDSLVYLLNQNPGKWFSFYYNTYSMREVDLSPRYVQYEQQDSPLFNKEQTYSKYPEYSVLELMLNAPKIIRGIQECKFKFHFKNDYYLLTLKLNERKKVVAEAQLFDQKTKTYHTTTVPIDIKAHVDKVVEWMNSLER